MTHAALINLLLALIFGATAFIALCRIKAMSAETTRAGMRLGYSALFTASAVGTLMFGAALVLALGFGRSLVGGDFPAVWVQWLGAWMLIYSGGVLCLLLAKAPGWRHGAVPPHARRPAGPRSPRLYLRRLLSGRRLARAMRAELRDSRGVL